MKWLYFGVILVSVCVFFTKIVHFDGFLGIILVNLGF